MTNLFTNDNPWLMIRPIQPWQAIKSLPPWETIAVRHYHNHFSHTTLDETLPSCVLDKPSHPNHLWQNISPIPLMFNHFTHSTHDKLFHSCYPWKTIVSSYLMTNKSTYATMKNLCNHTTVTKHFTHATHYKLFPSFTHDQRLNQYYPNKL